MGHGTWGMGHGARGIAKIGSNCPRKAAQAVEKLQNIAFILLINNGLKRI